VDGEKAPMNSPSPLSSLGLTHPVLAAPMAPVVSFTFALPEASVFQAFRRAGTLTVQTVTSASEARAAAVMAGTDPDRGDPVLTRAFSGRPARGLPNRFSTGFDSIAPLGYPAVHHLTSPLRKAATAAGDPELVNLWAGAGYRNSTTGPAAAILQKLASAS
jgi:NAD(P)H-dependent flavin oxidoreductase YrpB (nitropropane dioxygenase family)